MSTERSAADELVRLAWMDKPPKHVAEAARRDEHRSHAGAHGKYGNAMDFPDCLYTAMPYIERVQTVIETEAYLHAAKDAGMSIEEMTAAVDLVAGEPEAGDVMQGTGGVCKARLAGRGKGKSGGYRIVYYFGGGGHSVVPADRLRQGRESQPDSRRAECPPPADGNIEGESD